VPPLTTISAEVNVPANKASLKVNVKLTSAPVAAAEVMTTVGGTVSVVVPPPQAARNKVVASAQALRVKVRLLVLLFIE
jgi:hypothetical protein